MKIILAILFCFSLVSTFAQVHRKGEVANFPYCHSGNITQMSPRFSFSSSSDFTISMWCCFNSRPSGESTLIFYGTLDAGNFVWSIGTWNGQVAFGCAKQQSPNGWTIVGDPLSHLSTFRWHHITAVYKSGNISFYVDGELANTGKYNDSFAPSATMPFSIGVTNVGNKEPWNYFDGEIDNVKIYGRALSSYEIQDLDNDN